MGDEINKDELYGKFEAGEKRRRRLGHKLAAKALDIADDDEMNIDASRTGITTGGLVCSILAGGIPATILAALLAWQSMKTPCPSAPAAAPPADSKYKVTFYDKDGNLISVPHISARKE